MSFGPYQEQAWYLGAKGVEGILKRARYIVEYGANVEIQHVVLGYEGVALLRVLSAGLRNQ
jgi:hypothetical protein